MMNLVKYIVNEINYQLITIIVEHDWKCNPLEKEKSLTSI
ncbi:protein of unknown function [Petrocella atlantisensis]|uniref:Uncharacterized protein n=1 Tax=Petrocella atlantisensis TaxID=2173034 RepID=A0A3P7PWU7_9FIRM|nr:protein of unknown function [Petrocella atlantisensis]